MGGVGVEIQGALRLGAEGDRAADGLDVSAGWSPTQVVEIE
jgi:hypothetical protein